MKKGLLFLLCVSSIVMACGIVFADAAAPEPFPEPNPLGIGEENLAIVFSIIFAVIIVVISCIISTLINRKNKGVEEQ